MTTTIQPMRYTAHIVQTEEILECSNLQVLYKAARRHARYYKGYELHMKIETLKLFSYTICQSEQQYHRREPWREDALVSPATRRKLFRYRPNSRRRQRRSGGQII